MGWLIIEHIRFCFSSVHHPIKKIHRASIQHRVWEKREREGGGKHFSYKTKAWC